MILAIILVALGILFWFLAGFIGLLGIIARQRTRVLDIAPRPVDGFPMIYECPACLVRWPEGTEPYHAACCIVPKLEEARHHEA